MGRAAGYDQRELVRKARDLFWRRGFDAVSVTDVEQTTGVGRSSIYHAFGNMRGLFDAAVADYLDEVVRPSLYPFTAETVAPDALLNYLNGLRAAISGVAESDPHGCLLLTSASSPIGDDAAVHQVIADYRRELSGAIAAGVDAMLPDADSADRGRLSTLTTGSCIAALTLARVDPSVASATLLAATATLEDARRR